MHTIRRRLICAFAIIAMLFSVLAFRLGYIQVVATDQYASRAAENQIKDQVIPARRGGILDRNMKELAVSTQSYTIYLRLKPYTGDSISADERHKQLMASATLLSETLGMDKTEIITMLDSDSSRVRVARGVDKNKMDIIAAGIEKQDLSVIEVEEKSARDYPLGAFAAHVLGTVSADGYGQAGIEQAYDSWLSGQAGRNIISTDAKGNPIYGTDGDVHDKKDGLNVVSTIDETIQYHVEDAIQKNFKEMKPKQVEAIVMQPDTGEILAMAKYPEYDPNEPYTPIGKKAQEKFEAMTEAEQSDYLSEMWRNPTVSDLYEPGSVFKLITVSAALEEGAVTPETGVTCSGEYRVEDRTIHCHVYPAAHGNQSVVQAVGNSCNPGLIQIMQKMGYDKYSKYMDLFGVTHQTGIDLPAEANSLVQSKETAGPVGLATMAFGMGLNVTPIETISAVNAIVNGGNYVKPHIVKALADDDGNIVKEFKPEILRQVLSKQTAEEAKQMMEYVKDESGRPVIDVPGYRVGTKTGTAQKLEDDGTYSKDRVVCSMIAAAPMDDPQFIVLVVVDDPKEGGFGITVAGPAVREITDEMLRYMNIKPSSDTEDNGSGAIKIPVPKLKGMSVSEAKAALEAMGLNCSAQSVSGQAEYEVKAQYPAAGEYIDAGGFVYLYDK
jgi:stage V sporulation protein D (sporulation-specific penicillin-binding protein)